MKIAISAESTIDLPKELLEQYQIETIPFTVLLGEEQGLDGVLTPTQIFEYVDRTGVLPKTSAVNQFQYDEYFKNLLAKYDAVIHISLSSQISSSCQNAMNSAKAYPGKVFVIDSQSLSTGIALQCIYARSLANQGLKVEEIVERVTARREYVQASFVINTLDYLYKGGRCSSLARFGANLLRLKPQIIVDHGKMVSGAKYRGKNREVIEDYCKDTLSKFNNPDKSLIFVTHSSASPDMVETARRIVELHGFTNVCETLAGSTISSHCGPKCLGILYYNDGGKR